MKISYAITCYNEVKEINDLLGKLYRYTAEVSYEYEFVFLQDGSNGDLIQLLIEWARKDPRIFHYMHDLNNDFGTHKNVLNSHCNGDYIFNIDADEYPSSVLVQFVDTLIEQNPGVDLIWVPRVNTVTGLTDEHARMWGWRIDTLEGIDERVANWPDYQSRIYRNDPKIHWVNKVHEWIEGADKYTRLPAETIWAIFHPKNIEKQIQQNRMYSTIPRG